jgi:N-acetylglucosaminyl-diphospho-decaprenol L-rhamnosyltransferase
MRKGVERLVTAIVVNYRSRRDLEGCVPTLLTAGVDHIVIVDNGSSIEERVALERVFRGNSRVTLYCSERNLGFGAGVNRGAALVPEKYRDGLIWIVNPDILVDEDAMTELATAIERGQVEIASPVIYTGAHRAVWYGGGDLDIRGGLTRHSARELQRNGPLCYVDFITGAAPMMSEKTWTTLGGMREDLFLYWEDSDLSIRAKAFGMRLAVVPSARIWHRVGGSGSSIGKSQGYYYYMNRNRLIVCGEIVPKLGIVAGAGIRNTLRLWKAAALERQDRFRKLSACIAGTVDGLRGKTGPRAKDVRCQRGIS